MKILFVADGRSPIALNWIEYFVMAGYEVHLASIYPCQPELALASLSIIPVALSRAAGAMGKKQQRPPLKEKLLRAFSTPSMRMHLRHFFVPRSLPVAAGQLQSLILDLKPDIIHAMRIPYEGMLAALALREIKDSEKPPLVVSVWGNDFTLHAPATRRLSQLTRLTLECAEALHPDCDRDLRLARIWGFHADKPSMVLPGGGGVQSDIFYVDKSERAPIIVNPRGMRAYVRNDTFFRAIPLVLKQQPKARFFCPTMEGDAQAQRWVHEFKIAHAVALLPRQSRAQMADLFRSAQIVVSPSTHDGTPNTILEAMACGAFPVVGDIESLREWITSGENGLLIDPADPQALADAIIEGLQNPGLRLGAQKKNTRLILARAEFKQVMMAAENFYKTIL
jgi:glycosyltransferase involved in cell wall biosynthesis